MNNDVDWKESTQKAEDMRSDAEGLRQDAAHMQQSAEDADSAMMAEESEKVCPPDHSAILYELDVHMNVSILYDYMLRHTYTSLQGLIATILGVMCILFFAKGAGVIYLVAGIIIIAYLPWNLFLSAKRQALNNEAFQKPLHYMFTDEGIYVSQGDALEMQKWSSMYQAVATARSIIVYTSRVNACVFPRADLKNDTSVLLEIICRHMDPKKVKIRQ